MARPARQDPSAAEEIASNFLRNGHLGFKFRRECPVLDYRLDFYCAEAKLAVEFDGEQHEPLRDTRLAELGIEVLRIPNRSFFLPDDEPPVNIIEACLKACERLTGQP